MQNIAEIKFGECLMVAGKKIVFRCPGFQVGQPGHSRIEAFRQYFTSKGVSEGSDPDYIFCSMPPFRDFGIFFKKKSKIILDIRDGWSIAQASGYGGVVKKKPFKAFLTKIVERFLIRRAWVTITCTPGLKTYLERISGKKVILIPNGISETRLNAANEFRAFQGGNKEKECLIFSCAGKFSEYGEATAKKLIDVLVNRYSEGRLKLNLIGSNPGENAWVADYFFRVSGGRGYTEIFPMLDERSLFKLLSQSDYGIAIVRDPAYEFGTKVYDYIALGLPIVNYFDNPNSFTKYFDACLDCSFGAFSDAPEIRRIALIEEGMRDVCL